MERFHNLSSCKVSKPSLQASSLSKDQITLSISLHTAKHQTNLIHTFRLLSLTCRSPVLYLATSVLIPSNGEGHIRVSTLGCSCSFYDSHFGGSEVFLCHPTDLSRLRSQEATNVGGVYLLTAPSATARDIIEARVCVCVCVCVFDRRGADPQ